MKKLRSLRWRTLTRKGFIIAATPRRSIDDETRQPSARQSLLSDFARHPAALVILGFVLSGLVGSYLASIHEENVRQRESTLKSMDELRATIDDLSLAFARYDEHAVRLIELRQSGGPESAATAARAALTAASDYLEERLAVDAPDIIQRYPQKDGETSVEQLFDGFSYGKLMLDNCIDNDSLEPIQLLRRRYEMICGFIESGKVEITVSDRLIATRYCMGALTNLRPDPQFDFIRGAKMDQYRSQLLQAGLKYCQFSYVRGETRESIPKFLRR